MDILNLLWDIHAGLFSLFVLQVCYSIYRGSVLFDAKLVFS
jgi:hypothetical protein